MRAAFSDIARNASAAAARPVPAGSVGVLVQPMFTGVETLVGLTEDANFGPLVAFGLGGVSWRCCTTSRSASRRSTDADADALMRSVRGYPLLQGYRGRPACDVAGAARGVAARVAHRRARAGDRRARSQSGHRAAGRARLPHRRCPGSGVERRSPQLARAPFTSPSAPAVGSPLSEKFPSPRVRRVSSARCASESTPGT